jgi:hypothetical protein
MPKEYTLRRDSFNVDLDVFNSSIFPVSRAVLLFTHENSFCDEVSAHTIEIPIKGLRKHTISMSIISEHCGRYTTELKEIKVFDYLRFFSFKVRKIATGGSTVINPKIYDLPCYIESDDVKRESEKLSEYMKGDDPSQIFDLRDYIEGDKLNRLHWKLTIKNDSPIVKEFSEPEGYGFVIIFNFTTQTDIDTIDVLLETLFSVADFLAENKKSFKLCYNHAKYTEMIIENSEDIFQLSEIFLNNFENIDSNVLTDFHNANDIERFSHIIYITENVSADEFDYIQNFDFALKNSVICLNSEVKAPNLFQVQNNNIGYSLKEFVF